MSPAEVLQFAAASANIGLVERVNKGLPLSAAESLSEAVAPGDRNFKYRLVPRATFARRRKEAQAKRRQASVSPVSGERIVRLARVWALAMSAYKEADAARRFMSAPHPLLKGQSALDVTLDSEIGGKVVEDIIGRLIHGTGV